MNATRRRTTLLGALLPLALGTAACDDAATGPNGVSTVTITFATAAPSAPSAAYAPVASTDGESIVVTGSNGTLEITDIRFIVAEFELEHVDRGDDCDASGTGNPCREFHIPPYFVDLPLTGGPLSVGADEVPAGSYEELEFEIEDLEDDEEDPEKAQQIEALMNAIRAELPDWPDEAAMRLTGTFTPTDGEPAPFVVYLDAEVEIELEFEQPLVIADSAVDRTITVQIDPNRWLARGDGTVVNLAEYDYETTGALLEFEVEIENGFTEIEHEDDA
ncbi:MAG TPA: hypothetical protein VF158_03565 [Longimicrobiales bacterium]